MRVREEEKGVGERHPVNKNKEHSHSNPRLTEWGPSKPGKKEGVERGLIDRRGDTIILISEDETNEK